MKVDFSRLKGRMAEMGMNMSAMANALGISRTSFSLKMNGKREFTLTELRTICKVLNITDADPYFFDTILNIC